MFFRRASVCATFAIRARILSSSDGKLAYVISHTKRCLRVVDKVYRFESQQLGLHHLKGTERIVLYQKQLEMCHSYRRCSWTVPWMGYACPEYNRRLVTKLNLGTDDSVLTAGQLRH